MTNWTSLKVKIFFITLISLAILTACEEETPNEPPSPNYPDYYPDGTGSSFKYAITETDTLGNVVQVGTRNISYSGTANINGREYTTQEDSLFLDTLSSFNTFLFRKSETGIFYLVDTSQISLLIPDTLNQYVSLRDEMQLLFYPLANGSSWSLYRITADIQPGVEVKILDIVSVYENPEQINLNLSSGTVSVNSQKIKYTLEFYEDVNSDPQTYTAYMWFVENIGLVRFEGNQFLLSFSGGGINIEITSNILLQELIEYEIR